MNTENRNYGRFLYRSNPSQSIIAFVLENNSDDVSFYKHRSPLNGLILRKDGQGAEWACKSVYNYVIMAGS